MKATRINNLKWRVQRPPLRMSLHGGSYFLLDDACKFRDNPLRYARRYSKFIIYVKHSEFSGVQGLRCVPMNLSILNQLGKIISISERGKR